MCREGRAAISPSIPSESPDEFLQARVAAAARVLAAASNAFVGTGLSASATTGTPRRRRLPGPIATRVEPHIECRPRRWRMPRAFPRSRRSARRESSHPGPGFRSAEAAIGNAALKAQGIPLHRHAAGIGLSILGIVARPGPAIRAGRLHIAQDLDPDHRSTALGWVRILDVAAGRGSSRGDLTAESGTASPYPNRRVAVPDSPIADRVGRRAGLGENRRCENCGDQNPVMSHRSSGKSRFQPRRRGRLDAPCLDRSEVLPEQSGSRIAVRFGSTRRSGKQSGSAHGVLIARQAGSTVPSVPGTLEPTGPTSRAETGRRGRDDHAPERAMRPLWGGAGTSCRRSGRADSIDRPPSGPDA